MTQAAELETAVKTVWASIFNAAAVEARRSVGLSDGSVYMAAFVQRSVDARVSGVMITQDPFDPTRPKNVYVSAKRGLGTRVVEGQRIAEQSLYSQRSDVVQRFTRSAEDTALQLDHKGGVQEVKIDMNQPVLSDNEIRRLGKLALELKSAFSGTDQDIEWAIDGRGKIVVLQARPYGSK